MKQLPPFSLADLSIGKWALHYKQAGITFRFFMLLCVAFLDLVQYDVLFLSVLLSRILPDTGNMVEADDSPFTGFSVNYHTRLGNFFHNTQYVAAS